MKKSIAAALVASTFALSAQNPVTARFYHGVASGDARSDRVIIWTRVTPDVDATISAGWKVATDSLFAQVVKSGTASTDSSMDYTIKVDVDGLQPDTWYYYQFEHDCNKSWIGRTKTLPVGNNARIRLAVVSCANYGSGTYYNAYLSVANRNDIHAVLHLGDYIYESGQGGVSGTGITVLPDHELITLNDYRQRYNSQRLDPYLSKLHQQYPFYAVWDDHETANNSWEGGSGNHNPATEGDWYVRKANGQQAYFEWLPIRQQAPGDYKIYRTFRIGDLAELIMLDTRLEGRSEQATTTDIAALQDTNRTILGAAQMQWFKDQLSNSTATWKIVGQQVMIAPLLAFGSVVNADQWDGYQSDRNKVINHVLNNNIENVVFLTGDIHTSWANDVPGPGYNASTGAGSAFVEYVTPSITSGSFTIPGGEPVVKLANPHVKYVDLTQKGYFILDIDSSRVQADWTFVSSIMDPGFTESAAASWYVNAGEGFQRSASGPATGYTNTVPFAPIIVDTCSSVGINRFEIENVISVYPNPFNDQLTINIRTSGRQPAILRMYNSLGMQVFEQRIAPDQQKLVIEQTEFVSGVYLLELSNDELRATRTVVRLN